MTCPGIQATHQSGTNKAASHQTVIADRPADEAAAIATTPDGLQVKVEAHATVPMTMTAGPATATIPDAL